MMNKLRKTESIWSNRYFLKKPNRLKPKKGILILTGGGDGFPDPAMNIAKTAFHFLNVQFNPDLDYIRSLKTNNIPVRDDPNLAGTDRYGDKTCDNGLMPETVPSLPSVLQLSVRKDIMKNSSNECRAADIPNLRSAGGRQDEMVTVLGISACALAVSVGPCPADACAAAGGVAKGGGEGAEE